MEEFKLESKTIWNAVILIAIGLILTMSYLIYDEYSDAKKECNNLDGEFEYKFPSYYFCNNKSFYKYNDGWGYSKEFNLSELNLSGLLFP